MMGWQWHANHMQMICTSLQTDNHVSTLSLNLYRTDAPPLPIAHYQTLHKLPITNLFGQFFVVVLCFTVLLIICCIVLLIMYCVIWSNGHKVE